MAGILLGVIFLYLAYSAGKFLLHQTGFRVSEIETMVLAPALGLGVLSTAVLLLGLAGLLKPAFLWLLLLVPAMLAWRGFKGDFSFLRRGFSEGLSSGAPAARVSALLSLAILAAVIAGVLSPETANDSLCYHLHLPKLFLKMGRVGFIPYEFNSLFPFFMEMLYTLGLGIQGVELAKFLHFATGLLAAGGVWITARHLKAGWAAGAAALIFLTTPGLVNQLGTTYVEGGQACYTILSLYALLRWSETRESKWLLLAGVFSGWLLGIKYLGLIPILGFLTFLVWESRRGSEAPLVRSAAVFLAAVAAVSGYWYVRSWVELGNPVYPYFYSVFGAGDPTIHYDDIGVPKTLLSLLAVPWTITMHPEKFEGFGVQLGPAYLALLPAAYAYGWKKNPRLGFLSMFSIFYLICWFFLGQSLRFLMPLLPVLAVILASGLKRMEEEGLAAPIKIILALIFTLHAGLAFYHYRGDFRVALGLESRDEYLMRRERTYPAARFVNANLEPGAKILAADEAHLFYFNREIIRESVYATRSRYAVGAGSLDEVFGRLKKDGFTHLLLVDSPSAADPSRREAWALPRLAREREKELASFLEPIYTKQVKDLEGRLFVYRIYRIQIPTP